MSRGRSLLPLYRIAMQGLGWLAPALLNWRLARGKEDAARMREKTGIPGLPRPSGPLAWLHGASVGESISLLPLVEQLAARGLTVLVTTGTLSSARILAGRLGPRALHQYAPLDVPRFVGRFLAHWRPDIVLIAFVNRLIRKSRDRSKPLPLCQSGVCQEPGAPGCQSCAPR